MTEQPYFDDAGEPSDAAPRFVRPTADVAPLELVPGLTFQPVSTDSVMTNFVTFEPDAEAPTHHHHEQQIAIIVSGELTFTVGGETRVMAPGRCRGDPTARTSRRVRGPGGVRRDRRLHSAARGHRARDGLRGDGTDRAVKPETDSNR